MASSQEGLRLPDPGAPLKEVARPHEEGGGSGGSRPHTEGGGSRGLENLSWKEFREPLMEGLSCLEILSWTLEEGGGFALSTSQGEMHEREWGVRGDGEMCGSSRVKKSKWQE